MRISNCKTELAKARLSSGIHQKELAAKIGCTVSHLQKVESGERVSKSLVKKANNFLTGRI